MAGALDGHGAGWGQTLLWPLINGQVEGAGAGAFQKAVFRTQSC